MTSLSNLECEECKCVRSTMAEWKITPPRSWVFRASVEWTNERSWPAFRVSRLHVHDLNFWFLFCFSETSSTILLASWAPSLTPYKGPGARGRLKQSHDWNVIKLKCNQSECNLALADCNTKSHNLPDRKGVHAREPTHFKLFKKSSISALACLLSNRISLLRKKWDGFIKCCVSFAFKVVRKKPSFQLNSPFI